MPIDQYLFNHSLSYLFPLPEARLSFKIPKILKNLTFELSSQPLKAVVNPGGSGALMWFSQNHEFVIKTVAREQSNFLYKMLRGYYLNMDQNPNTLLTKFYGLYTLKQNGK